MFDRGLQRVREYLGCSQEEGGACLICLGLIKPSEAVWDCKGGCYAVMHLNCIQVRGSSRQPTHSQPRVLECSMRQQKAIGP